MPADATPSRHAAEKHLADKIRTYPDFWPYYLREHSKPATRGLHFVGTALVFVALAAALWTRNLWLLLLVPAAGYAFAWIGHFAVEKNTPATFGYPFWSLISDFRMFFVWLFGGLGGELRKYNIVARA